MNRVEKLMEDAKEALLGKEMTLLELDNEAASILETSASMFDYDVFKNALDEDLKSGNYIYNVNDDTHDIDDDDDEIAIDFDVIEKPKVLEDATDAFNIVVKVTDIWKH